MAQRRGFTQLSHRLRVPYRRVFDAGVAGKFPCEFIDGRWSFDEADLPAIAEALGVSLIEQAAA